MDELKPVRPPDRDETAPGSPAEANTIQAENSFEEWLEAQRRSNTSEAR